MRKRILRGVLCLLFLSCLLLCGCHGSRSLEPFDLPEEFDTARSFEITFWAKNDTNKNQVAVYKKAIADFQSLYPNITVNLRLYTDYRRIYTDVITNIPTQTTPNVCITYPDHIATYLSGSNIVVPLNDLISDKKYGLGGTEVRFDSPSSDEVVSQFLGECSIGDFTYALPFMRSTEACYINKTFVEALGYEVPDILTWDFVWEVSEAAVKKDGEGNFLLNGQKVMIPFIYKSTDNMMIQYLKQRAADYSNSRGEILLFNETTRQFLMEISKHAGTGSFSTFKISSYPANFLNAGQCVFAIDSTAGATWMGSEAPLLDISEDQLVDFEIVVRPVPQYDPENPKMISQGPSVCIFNKRDPQEVLASWLFAQYLLTDDVQIPYSETEGYAPVTVKAQQSAVYRDYLARSGEDGSEHYFVKIEATKVLLENLDKTFVTPVFNGSASVRDAAGELIEDVTKSVRRKQTVDDPYMDDLFSNISSLYRLDQLTHEEKGKTELGPLPAGSVALLISLVFVWVLLGGLSLIRSVKSKRK